MALGDTFTELENLNYAKKAYKRAISCGGANMQASIEKMARICLRLKLSKKTAQYWELFLQESEGQRLLHNLVLDFFHKNWFLYFSEILEIHSSVCLKTKLQCKVQLRNLFHFGVLGNVIT